MNFALKKLAVPLAHVANISTFPVNSENFYKTTIEALFSFKYNQKIQMWYI